MLLKVMKKVMKMNMCWCDREIYKGSQKDVGNDSTKISRFNKTWKKDSAIIKILLHCLVFGQDALHWPEMTGWNGCYLGSGDLYGWWKMKKTDKPSNSVHTYIVCGHHPEIAMSRD